MNYYNPYKDEIKDKRLELLEEKLVGDIKFCYYILHPKLINHCPVCNSSDTIKYGQKTRNLNIKILAHYKSMVTIKYTRFKCKSCGKLFVDQLDDVNKGERISKSTKIQILLDLKKDISFDNIAEMNNVSRQTVLNIFESCVYTERKTLPDVMCMDEFKNLSTGDGKYAFLIFDPNNHCIIDVLPDRKLDKLKDYFFNIPYKERLKVKYIVTDMYEPYRTIINKCFPHSTHIIDNFHYIKYVTKAFNDVRIRTQDSFTYNSPQYKILKYNWKLLLTYVKELPDEEIYNPIQKKKTTASEIVTDALSLSSELSEAYNLLQDFLIGWNTVKFEGAKKFVEEFINSLIQSEIKEFHNIHSTFSNWKHEIINSFIRFGEKRLNNGYIEGMNNRIKEIKRIAFGYSNFYHFKMRIMYIVNEDIPLRNIDTDLIPRIRRHKYNKD